MEADAVVALIQEHAIPCVRGNHDSDSIGNQAWLRENAIPDHPSLLRNETIAYLSTLPKALWTTIKDKRIMLAHGTPWSEHVYLYANNPRIVYERVIEEAQADVILVGHTHQPMCVHIDGKFVLNPGAVYSFGSQTCAMLTLPACEFKIFSLESGQPIEVPAVDM
jgi:putative phosphoesterase